MIANKLSSKNDVSDFSAYAHNRTLDSKKVTEAILEEEGEDPNVRSHTRSPFRKKINVNSMPPIEALQFTIDQFNKKRKLTQFQKIQIMVKGNPKLKRAMDFESFV